ncbi:MAG: hypothetical protein MI740_10280 [Halanaerobiales bacterium]|nr:hypothetical protein [Halanaerobiales bacterium]
MDNIILGDFNMDELESRINQTQSVINRILQKITETNILKAQEKHRNFSEMSEEYLKIKDKLLGFPHVIQKQKENIAGLEEIADQADQELRLLEDTQKLQIINEVDSAGKKFYSNDTARNAALGQWKQHDLDYQEAWDELKEAKRNLEQAKFELDRAYNEYKSYQAIAGMLSARIKMLA